MTAKENATISSAEGKTKEAVEPFTNYFIGRLKQDWNKGNTTLGGIATSTLRNIKEEQLDFLADKSFVGGFDFEHNWKNRKYYVNTKSFYSKIDGSETAISRLQRSSPVSEKERREKETKEKLVCRRVIEKKKQY